MPRIVSVATALPPHRCEQSDTRDAMARVCRGDRAMERLLPVFDRTGVETRYLARPLDWYAEGQTFETRNDVFVECGLDLAERAARTCLETSGIAADQIDHVFFVTTTGLSTPSLDARVAVRLGLRADVRRLPLFGLGCAGGAGARQVVRGGGDIQNKSADPERLLAIKFEFQFGEGGLGLRARNIGGARRPRTGDRQSLSNPGSQRDDAVPIVGGVIS